MTALADRYYLQPAAAFVRGRALAGDAFDISPLLLKTEFARLTNDDLEQIFAVGLQAGLRLHKFKRTMGLARVIRVLGSLQMLLPSELLDIGTGRGVFLWPLLDRFDTLPVTAVDRLQHRADDLQAVHNGGVSRLLAKHADAVDLPFANDHFDVCTVLEVLEHIPQCEQALAEIVRVTRRFVILSVPSKEDDNPEHIHLFDEYRLRKMLARLGANNISVDYVLNHIVLVANVQ